MIAENIRDVERRIVQACERSGRNPEEITLVAVSKTKPVEKLEEAYAAGKRVFGENKVQELVDKYEVMPKDIKWQMIGHLQRNKVKYIIDKVDLIHSVDSIRLVETIDREAAKKGIIANILLEVNMAKEESKFGLMPEEVMDFIDEVVRYQNVRVQGLMTIAPFVDDPESNRKHFANLHKLLVDIRKKKVNNVTMNVLSMGMTNDFEVAIEEGATMVRVGTAIFGERNYVQ
ncbi:MAG: YggS family pyridoxal phosphate-dependent enzyme [bacterium]|nr:YggS family pyridoxal phosphate-dependent enzyme [bacterium]